MPQITLPLLPKAANDDESYELVLPISILDFQRMFPDDLACAKYIECLLARPCAARYTMAVGANHGT